MELRDFNLGPEKADYVVEYVIDSADRVVCFSLIMELCKSIEDSDWVIKAISIDDSKEENKLHMYVTFQVPTDKIYEEYELPKKE